jgi:hypothetical protein
LERKSVLNLRSLLRIIDAVINLILGLLLVAFPLRVFEFLGLPIESPPFYAIVLGGVLVGMGIALLMGHGGIPRTAGLGLNGAIVINLFGAIVLATLLVSGRIYIALRGYAVLWGLVLLLVAISTAQWWVSQKGEAEIEANDDQTG